MAYPLPMRALPVFSTLVEVFLEPTISPSSHCRLLHARGGVSERVVMRSLFGVSSPRSWRCFSPSLMFLRYFEVFSTLVEVFHRAYGDQLPQDSLLHARGGVS